MGSHVEAQTRAVTTSESTSATRITLTQSPLERLGPKHLLRHILDDWFENIHAIAPILLRRQFLKRFDSSEAETNLVFCGLVVSIICATCATLRRRSFSDYGGVTAERCYEIVELDGLLPSDGPYSLDWCVAKYNLSASSNAVSTLPLAQANRYTTDAQLGVNHLLHHGVGQLSFVDGQLLKRLYWLLVVGDM